MLAAAGLAGTLQALPLQDETNADFVMVPQKGGSFQISSLSLSPDGKYFITGSEDSTIQLYTKDPVFLRTFKGHSDRVLSVSFTSDGEHFVSASMDRTVKLWSINGQLLRSF